MVLLRNQSSIANYRTSADNANTLRNSCSSTRRHELQHQHNKDLMDDQLLSFGTLWSGYVRHTCNNNMHIIIVASVPSTPPILL